MKIFAKILSTVLIFGAVIGAFASCDGAVNGQQTADDGKYKINVSITYATDDAKLKDAVMAMSVNGATVLFDGENLSVDSTASVGDTSVKESYVLIDGVLYRDMSLTSGGNTATVKEKAAFDEQNRQTLLSDLGAGASVGIADFEDFEISSSGDNTYYDCTNIKAESADSLEKIFGSGLSSVGASVSLSNAEYQKVMQGEKIVESTLSCHFTVLLAGESYELTMHMIYMYDYTSEVSIAAPEGADSYTAVSYEEIIK